MPGPAGFFTRRWRGEVPQPVLFWRDLALVGTAINLLTTGLALALVASGAPMVWAVALHFSTLPYNLFLVAAVWRLPASAACRWASLGWLALVTLV